MRFSSPTSREQCGSVTTLWVGESQRSEFSETRQVIAERSALLTVPVGAAAGQLLAAGGVVPEVIVLAQSRPGEVGDGVVEQLRRAAPLARMVGLLGPWCEGEARTGRPWPGVVRVYWYHGASYFARNLEELASGKCPSWGAPLTANDEDRALAVGQIPSAQPGRLAIAARHRETYRALTEACQLAGWQADWVRSKFSGDLTDFAAGLWIGGDLCDWESDDFRRFCQRLEQKPVLALLDFPRAETVDRARRLGAASVLARPFQVEDLCWRLEEVTGQDRGGGLRVGAA